MTDLSRVTWRTSSWSGGNGECVEVAGLSRATAVRDSKDPDGPALLFSASEWSVFGRAVKAGRFDRN